MMLRAFLAICLCAPLGAASGCNKMDSGSPPVNPRVDAQQDAPQGRQAEAGNAEPNLAPKGAAAITRKIRYAATIQLITEDFARAERDVPRLIKEADGYLASSEMAGSPGSIRTGFWKVRIPVKEFDGFRAAVLKLGEVEKNATDSQDVTEEYYDLENNIKNRQAEEEALRKLLDKAADKMENFLAIRRELNQVREDIDRKLGRLKLLANLTDMTTVALTIREKQKYVPDKAPDLAETPTFGTRVGKTFRDSASSLASFFQSLALVVAALAPWLPLFLTVGTLAWVIRRRQRALTPPVPTMEGPSPQG